MTIALQPEVNNVAETTLSLNFNSQDFDLKIKIPQFDTPALSNYIDDAVKSIERIESAGGGVKTVLDCGAHCGIFSLLFALNGAEM